MKQVADNETKEILRIAEDCLRFDGDFVEFGCFEGDTSLLLAGLLKEKSKTGGKKLWIYDSFEGLPEKSVEDYSEAGRDFKKGELFVTKAFVKKRFLRANLPVPVIKKAWFSELNPTEDLPEKISFAFLDGDLYDSIKTSFELCITKMGENGIIVVHDYQNPQLPGVTRAVDEFVKETGARLELTASLAILSK